jgi:hypothetical protein
MLKRHVEREEDAQALKTSVSVESLLEDGLTEN